LRRFDKRFIERAGIVRNGYLGDSFVSASVVFETSCN
jgi:hypothetical protein